MKKMLAILLALCLLAAPVYAFAAATETDAAGEPAASSELMTLRSVADVATFILEPVKWCEVQIVPAVLTTEDGAKDVYLVALRGTGFSLNKANNVLACFLSAFNLSSNYYRLARDSVFEHVPEGATLVAAGHSLGGMVLQQLSCTPEFTEKYELINTLNVGSPYVLTKAENREGALARFVEKSDVIPKLGPGALLDFVHYNDFVKVDGGYLGDPNGAHNLSYMREDLLGGYDALGVKDGGATLTLDPADIIMIHT